MSEHQAFSLARLYHLSTVDQEILKLCQRIMIARREAASIAEGEETCADEERINRMDQRVALYDKIEKDMRKLDEYVPEGLYAARRILEIVADVLAHRLMDHMSWLGKGPIELLVAAVLQAVVLGAEAEAHMRLHVEQSAGRLGASCPVTKAVN